LNSLFEHWRELLRSILGSFAAIFLLIEAIEVLGLGDISLALRCSSSVTGHTLAKQIGFNGRAH